jgi:hypothetical protein
MNKNKYFFLLTLTLIFNWLHGTTAKANLSKHKTRHVKEQLLLYGVQGRVHL